MRAPIDIVLCLHNAFRRDTLELDDAAFKAARSGADMTPIFDRLNITGEILDYHAKGEDDVVFPAVEKVASLVTKSYFLDHRELDAMVAGLKAMQTAPDALTVARATAVLNGHLRIHLNKEDAHLYAILRERTTDAEQVDIGALMSRSIPPDKYPTMIQWVLPLLDFEDQVVVAKGWANVMPPPVLVGIRPLIQKSVAGNWTNLIRSVPELEQR